MRRAYERRGGRYASDMTDEEWALIASFMPARKRTGGPRTTALRGVCDALLYIAATGYQWAMIPKDFPPPQPLRCWHIRRNQRPFFVRRVACIAKVIAAIFRTSDFSLGHVSLHQCW